MTTATATLSNKQVTPTIWATALLEAVGAPVTNNNVNNIKLWLHNEQSPSSWYNDVNNPLGVGGGGLSTAPNYGGPAGGIAATANLLTSSGNYASIVNALKANAPTQIFATAVVSSPWNGNRYGGYDSFVSKGPLTLNNEKSTSGPGNEVSRLLGDLGLPGGGVVQDVSGTVTGTASGTAKLLGDITSATFWKRVGVFTGGLGLVVGGVVLFVVTSKPGQKAVETVSGAAGAAAALA